MPDRSDASILHVDLDAFYASVEQLADPSIRGRPVIVGGLGHRGVVAAASYEARRFGVHSAMPMSRARRACPNGVFLAPRFEQYGDASKAVMTILRSFTPLVEPLALDEAFLDVAGTRRLHGTGPDAGAAIRARVRAETGLVASVGAATTKHIAKLASQEAKPDGLFVVEPGEELAFLHPLDVGRLWGVGPAARKRLDQLGVHTVGELAELSEGALVHALGPAQGGHLHALAWNRDDRPVVPHQEAKSVGHEETFARDIADRSQLEREALRLAERVAARLRAAGRAGRTIQLKVRFRDFRTITRSRTVAEATAVAAEISSIARELLDAVDIGDGVRLLGVSVQQLEEAKAVQEQLPLDEGASPAERHAAVERSVDALRERFGDDAVGLASLSDRDRGPRYLTKERVQEPE
ncbi:MAG TPA: DNA polymerase IV [Acidimicrobiia bacterium]|nr:DNA polymerase IV [Acidimicrobiia bacterium]